MYKISKQFTFSASHQLNMLSADHPCARMHGHNYVITIHLRSETLDEYGFVKDYKALDMVKQYLNTHLDHRHLNDILPNHPTSENIARFLYEKFKPEIPELCAVEVSETPQTSCVYEPLIMLVAMVMSLGHIGELQHLLVFNTF
ncbi:6-carboxy-5,6,7,8-tetrahydropterin synthase [Bacteroidia bacterium]|nr:6-carboxy-5,6,7,8-tetrahydropterin synthase [Bacteroidia bacterium]